MCLVARAHRADDASSVRPALSAVGKSTFGLYLLWRAVLARRTVVYASANVHRAFIFPGDGRVEAFAFDDFRNRAWDICHLASTVLICDAIRPPVTSAFTVLITEPKRDRWWEFNKETDATLLAFPVFSRDEIDDMHRACFPNRDATACGSATTSGAASRATSSAKWMMFRRSSSPMR